MWGVQPIAELRFSWPSALSAKSARPTKTPRGFGPFFHGDAVLTMAP
jgi:hypothetical protein